MEQIGETQPNKRTRISWRDPNVMKTFLESCVLEVSLNGKEGSALKPTSWIKVSETLKASHNFTVDKKQMRNKFGSISQHEQMTPFPFTIQRNVVIACFAIHNFIRKCNIQDQLFEECNEDTIFNNEEEGQGSGEEGLDITQWGANSTQYMANLRDEIANNFVSNA
ncbi:hypothetical protein OROGR_011262 [Orobanche gracilis]